MKELLELRLELSKTSIKKYEAMARCICKDGRVHGLLQFGGASRTFRWAGRLVQAQNLPPEPSARPEPGQRHREARRRGTAGIVVRFGSQYPLRADPHGVHPQGWMPFIVADFSAIEARVLAWLAGEEWVLEEFAWKGKIYEATASRMFHIPQETIVKGHPNYTSTGRRGKQATLSCGYGGGVGALKAMGRENARGGNAAAGGCLARSESAHRAVLERAGQCRLGGD